MIARSGRAVLAYDVIGEPRADAEPVLLVHAGVTDRRSWGPLTDRLALTRQVIRFDMRGFGETTYEPEPWSRVDDAVAVLDAAGAARAAVVGASMGGSAAIDLTLAHPDRVERLVLIAPAVSGAPDVFDDTE
ncbi:MAG TPA: alpha/beta fold hydrolase, partial [Jiangellaceae bacterium]|nr:alpha/beta fold hydrolase [Jiangellaceae bacterium]